MERNTTKPTANRKWSWLLALVVALIGLWFVLDYADRHAAGGRPGRYTVF
jgi:hypothetical protein